MHDVELSRVFKNSAKLNHGIIMILSESEYGYEKNKNSIFNVFFSL